MQTRQHLCVAFLAATSIVAGADTTTPLTPEQTSQYLLDINSYASQVITGSSITYYVAALSSAIPSFYNDPSFKSSALAGTTPFTALPGFTAMPKDAQSFWASERDGELKIISKDLYSPASVASPTGVASPAGVAPRPTGVLVAAGAAAAGVLGLVAVL